MEEVATITFEDLDTKSEAVAIVKRDAESVLLALSIRVDGDIQVVMRRVDARRLLEALQTALA
jgi:hypothetical protein